MGEARLRVVVGEYAVEQRVDGSVRAERHGVPWRDCIGDNLVLALAQEVADLRERMAQVRAALANYEVE